MPTLPGPHVRRCLVLALVLLAPALLAAAAPATALRTVRTVGGVRRGNSAVFEVRRFAQAAIRRATVLHRGRRRRVAPSAVRRAARSGRLLRIRVGHRRHRRHGRGRFRLRIVISGPPTAGSASRTGPCAVAAATTPSPQTEWRPASTIPMSDAAAAAAVSDAPEDRPDNRQANAHCPTDSELAAYHAVTDAYGQSEADLGDTFNPYHAAVSGRFVGTTDEIVQWAAHKWGIPEDVLRAQLVHESDWHQSTTGDRTTVTDPLAYPGLSQIPSTSDVYESLGIAQVRWRPGGSLHPGTEPLRWQSTAFDVDYLCSVIRFYYDDPMGHRTNWGDAGYHHGDAWLSVGGWFSPYPWGNEGQRQYARHVQGILLARPWDEPDF